jgi:hypothetical protein
VEILIIAILIGLLPAYLAKKKGRSFGLWWVYGAALFIVALPRGLLMSPLPGSEEALMQEAIKKSASNAVQISSTLVDFTADGVILGAPFRYEPDGGIVALVAGKTIKFKDKADLEAVLRSTQHAST